MAPVNRVRAGIYVRISQDREGGGLGVERQEGDCRQLAADVDWDVVDVYTDNDVSAYGGKVRREYRRLLGDLESGRINGVLAWHTDRVYKAQGELEHYIDVCQPRAVPTRTVKAGELDLTTPTGRMVARVVGAIGHAESERIGERVAAARAQARAAGRPNGGQRPFGFDADGVTLREHEAVEIARATDAILTGGSLRGIVLDWNRRGIVTSTGKPWHSRTLRDMLLRHRNAGLIAHHGDVIGPAVWPGIVTEDQRTRLEQILTDPARRTSPGNTVKYLGSHLYTCGQCGQRRMVCYPAGGTRPGHSPRRNAYRCRDETTGGGSHLARDQEKTDALVVETILNHLKRDDVRDAVPLDTDPGVDTAAITEEIRAIRERRKWMIDAATDGTLTEQELRTRLGQLTERTTLLEAELAAAPSTSPVRTLVTADDVDATWAAMDLGSQRAVVDFLCVVTLLPGARSGPRFDYSSVDITWR